MNDLELETWKACREADEAFEKDESAGTKEWIREYFLPSLEKHGLKITTPEKLTLKQLQEEQRPWVLHNFGVRPSWYPLLGAVEELGELAHAHLKEAQGIRTTEDHVAGAKDAVADTIIFLADYCSSRGFDLQEIVEQTWAKVKLRDWKKDKNNAGQVEQCAMRKTGMVR